MNELLNELKICLEKTNLDENELKNILYNHPVIDFNMIEKLKYIDDPDEIYQKEFDKFQEYMNGKKVKIIEEVKEEVKIVKEKEIDKSLNFKYFKEKLKELKQNISEENKDEILKREYLYQAFKQYFNKKEVKNRFESREDWNKVEKLIKDITDMNLETFLKEMNIQKFKNIKVNKNKMIDKLKKFPMNWYQKYIYENLRHYTITENEYSIHDTHLYDWKQGLEMSEESKDFINNLEKRFQETNEFHGLEWNHEWNENQKISQYANFLLTGRINEWRNDWYEYESKKKKTKVNPKYWNSVYLCWELLKDKIDNCLEHQKELETFEFYLNLLMNQKNKKIQIESKQIRFNDKTENELSIQNKLVLQNLIKTILRYVYLYRKDPLKFISKKRKELKESIKNFVIKNIFNIKNALISFIYVLKIKINGIENISKIKKIILFTFQDPTSITTQNELKIPYLLMNYPNLKERIQKYSNTNRIKKEDIQSFVEYELNEIEKII